MRKERSFRNFLVTKKCHIMSHASLKLLEIGNYVTLLSDLSPWVQGIPLP